MRGPKLARSPSRCSSLRCQVMQVSGVCSVQKGRRRGGTCPAKVWLGVTCVSEAGVYPIR